MAKIEKSTMGSTPSDGALNGALEGQGVSSSPTQMVLPRVYEELRTLAGAYLKQERPDHTLQPTALVHETYMRLKGSRDWPWKTEADFIAIAASVMRKVLIDHARRHGVAKRGGGAPHGDANRLTLHQVEGDPQLRSDAPRIDLLDLDDSLKRLEHLHPRQARLVELRYFGGLSIEAVAELLDISLRTAAYDWRMARAWLLNQLAG